MKAKNFYIPDGIEYYMPSDAVKLEKIKSKILKIYAKYNYTYVIPPIFDNLDNLLNLKSTDLDSETALVLDKRTSKEIGIRADITPQISKIDYQMTKGSGNSRFSYMGDILRLSPGPFDRINPYQTGAEYFGKLNNSIDTEIIKLMIDLVLLSNEKKIVIELGDLSFINNLLLDLNLNDFNRSALIDLINLKSTCEIKEFFKINKLNVKKLNLLIELINLSGDIKVLKELKSLIRINKIKASLELTNLTSIANSINKFRGISEVQIDLCELHGFNYQSGLIYTAYVPNLRKEIARGGRYVAYNINLNKPRHATGFSLDIKDILNLSVGRRDTYV